MDYIMIGVLVLFKVTSGLECHGHQLQFKVQDDNGNFYCRDCSKCPPGQGVSTDCSEFSDTVCADCISGISYSTSSSVDDICEPCTMCSPKQQVLRNCTTTTNSQCGECETGYFLDELSDFCDKCWYCYPGISIYIADCDRPGVLRGYHCMQINNPPYPPPASTTVHKETTSKPVAPTVHEETSSKPATTVRVEDTSKLKHYPTQHLHVSPIVSAVNMSHVSGAKENMIYHHTSKDPEAISNGAHWQIIAWFIAACIIGVAAVCVLFIFKKYKQSKQYSARPLNSISKDVESSDDDQTEILKNEISQQVGDVDHKSNGIEECGEACRRGSADSCLNSQVIGDQINDAICKITENELDNQLYNAKTDSVCPSESAKLFVRHVSNDCNDDTEKLGIPMMTRHISTDSAYYSEYDGTADDCSDDADLKHLIPTTEQDNLIHSRRSPVSV